MASKGAGGAKCKLTAAQVAELGSALDAGPWFPAYASELNPVESVWSNLKRSLANLVKHDLPQLTVLAKSRLRHMQYRPGLIDGFLTGTRRLMRSLRLGVVGNVGGNR